MRDLWSMARVNWPNRRTILAGLAGAVVAPSAHSNSLAPGTARLAREALPAIGMGSWRTFDVGSDQALRASRRAVLKAFFENGGALIDSSPMYGSSQSVIGAGLQPLGGPPRLFAADKVWVSGRDAGQRQASESLLNWNIERFDLLQVHNLVDWRVHLPWLFDLRAAGALRYVGVTSYSGIRYDEMARIVETEPVDFIQLTYNVADREAEQRLLPLALERGVAVIANRPFREGALFGKVRGASLPPVAREIGATNWAQFFLKFIVSHPAVTAAIPATSRVDHMIENMGALRGPKPDAAIRRAMVSAFEEI